MKLVDILARELKVWPHNVFAITQDDGGELNGNSIDDPAIMRGSAWGGGAFYLDDPVDDGGACFRLMPAEDWSAAIVTRAQWQAAVDALKAPPIQIIGDIPKPGWIVPEMTADLIANDWLESPALHCQKVGRVYRLPPIGSTVRIDKGERVVWDSAEMFIGVDVTLVSTFMTGDTQMVAVEHPVEKVCHCFRADMVRTPEQIASTERESAIKAFMKIGDIYYCDAEKLYDAGARLPGEGKKV